MLCIALLKCGYPLSQPCALEPATTGHTWTCHGQIHPKLSRCPPTWKSRKLELAVRPGYQRGCSRMPETALPKAIQVHYKSNQVTLWTRTFLSDGSADSQWECFKLNPAIDQGTVKHCPSNSWITGLSRLRVLKSHWKLAKSGHAHDLPNIGQKIENLCSLLSRSWNILPVFLPYWSYFWVILRMALTNASILSRSWNAVQTLCFQFLDHYELTDDSVCMCVCAT